MNDNIICYFNTLLEFATKFGYEIKELNRKYRKNNYFINLNIDSISYKLFVFEQPFWLFFLISVEIVFFHDNIKLRKEIDIMDIQVEAYIVERVSQKGKPYKAVEIYITDKVKKLVFLTEAEMELLKIANSKK